MLKRSLVLTVAAVFLAGAAFAGVPGQGKSKKTPKLTDVKFCPISGKAASGDSGGTEVVGKYKVHFCCADCQPQFDKLSRKEKVKKLAALAKKSNKKKG